MKTLFCLLIGLIQLQSINAQQIVGLDVYPPSPVAGYPVTLIADACFPYGGCNMKSLTINQNGNDFITYAIHCLGPLTYICYDTDSFQIGSLAAGNYRFIYSVDAGYFPPPCTPGIVPGPSDTLLFTVSPSTAVEDVASNKKTDIYLVDKVLHINPFTISQELLYIYNSSGQEIMRNKINGKSSFDLNWLNTGIYTVLINSKNQKTIHRFLIAE
jgi:Secretion system C-terminal sorting domain